MDRFPLLHHLANRLSHLAFGKATARDLKSHVVMPNKPNQTLEPTPGSVTSRAVCIPESMAVRNARLAPAPVVAHL